jgi:adenosylcobinamide-GDP ribazoletransferase
MNERTDTAAPRTIWWPILALADALRFLTIIPIPGRPPLSNERFARSVALFPLAGALIGALLAGLGVASGLAWGAEVRPALLVVAWGDRHGRAAPGWHQRHVRRRDELAPARAQA